MSQPLPGVSPFPFPYSDADKRKTNTLLPPTFQLFHAGPTALPLFSHRLHSSKTRVHSCIRNAFHKYMPDSQAHFRSHKQARPWRLSKQQRRYQRSKQSSMAWFPTILVEPVVSGLILAASKRKLALFYPRRSYSNYTCGKISARMIRWWSKCIGKRSIGLDRSWKTL